MERTISRLRKGDILNLSFIRCLKDKMPVITETKLCLQLGDAADYAYTLDGHLKPVYQTFTEFKGEWRYCGLCFKNETTDKSWR